MKIDIVWTTPAFTQLELLPAPFAFEIVSRADLLASFPEMGVSLRSLYPELDNCRQLIVGKSYRVIYDYDSDSKTAFILAVQHCKLKLPSARELKRKLSDEDL